MSGTTEKRRRRLQSSRERYRRFVDDYKARRLDERADAAEKGKTAELPPEGGEEEPGPRRLFSQTRRTYLREYLRWLWPYRFGVGGLFLLALVTTGLQMIEPLFMRFIIDRVLLDTSLDPSARLTRLNFARA